MKTNNSPVAERLQGVSCKCHQGSASTVVTLQTDRSYIVSITLHITSCFCLEPHGTIIVTARRGICYGSRCLCLTVFHKLVFYPDCIAHTQTLWLSLLWSPYVIGQTIIFLPCDFFLSIYLLLSFFPRLISAVGDWISTILLHMAWPNLECRSETCCTRFAANTGRKKVAKNRHLAPSHNFVGLYLRN